MWSKLEIEWADSNGRVGANFVLVPCIFSTEIETERRPRALSSNTSRYAVLKTALFWSPNERSF